MRGIWVEGSKWAVSLRVGSKWAGVRLGLLGLILMGLAPSAQADDCGCGSYAPIRTARGFRGGYGHGGGGSCSVRDPHHPSTRYVIPRYGRSGYGRGCGGRSNWFALRRGLRSHRRPGTSTLWVRQYFMRRYPFSHVQGEELEHMDRLLAKPVEDEKPLDEAARLDRGMARFFISDYAAARSDFEAVLATQPEEHRARYGVLLCAICRSDWRNAADTLGVLAKAGQLKADDRLLAEGSFMNPAVLDSQLKALQSYAQHKVTDGHAYLVAAWTLASTDRSDLAKRYLRMAKRWKGSNPAVGALEMNLGVARPQTKAQPTEVRPTEVRPTEPQPPQKKSDKPAPIRAPSLDLHRQIAQKTQSR